MASSESDLSRLNSMAIGQKTHPNHSGSPPEINHQSSENSILEIDAVNECRSVASTKTKQVNSFDFSACFYICCVVQLCSLVAFYTLLRDG